MCVSMILCVCESVCVHTDESDVDYHTAAISVSAGVLSVCLYMSYSSALSPVRGVSGLINQLMSLTNLKKIKEINKNKNTPEGCPVV